MILIILYDFIQDLNIKRRLYTKDDYFSTNMLFTTIYLLQEQKLNHNNYFEQKINMIYFIQSNKYYMFINAKFQCMYMHVVLQINTSILTS
jgi:hypothetical protein